jgi:pyruvate-formate lyase
MQGLLKAMEDDFKGHEVLRARLINKAPKYGNDLDYVDDLAWQVSQMFCDEFAKYQNTRGGGFRAGFWSVTANYGLGDNTAATPDGRGQGSRFLIPSPPTRAGTSPGLPLR